MFGDSKHADESDAIKTSADQAPIKADDARSQATPSESPVEARADGEPPAVPDSARPGDIGAGSTPALIMMDDDFDDDERNQPLIIGEDGIETSDQDEIHPLQPADELAAPRLTQGNREPSSTLANSTSPAKTSSPSAPASRSEGISTQGSEKVAAPPVDSRTYSQADPSEIEFLEPRSSSTRVPSRRAPGMKRSGDWRDFFDQALEEIDWSDDPSPVVQQDRLYCALQAINKAILNAPESELGACRSTRGYIHLSLGDFDRAEDDCGAAYEADGQDVEALVWRGCARAGRQRWLPAVEDLTEAIDLGGERSREYSQTRDRIVKDALEQFRERVRVGAADAELFYERGRIYECLEQTDKALRDFRQAYEADAQHLAARLGIAASLLKLGRLADALHEVNLVLVQPHQWRKNALKLRAKIHQAAGHLSDAINDLSEVKALDPQSVELRIECGEIGLHLGDYAGAIDDLTFAVKSDRSLIKPRDLRAIAYVAAKNYELAIRDLDYLIKRNGNKSEWLVLRGEAHRKKHDLGRAERDFRAALDLDELDARAYLGMGQVLAASKKHEAAHAHCDRAIRLDSRMADAFLLRGKLWFDDGHREEAVEAFSRGLQLEPPDRVAADCHYRRGICFCQLGRFDDALNDFETAVNKRDHHAGSYVWRSSASAALGMWGEAISDLKRAIEVNPGNSEAYRKLGEDICRRAIDQFSQALSRNDEDSDALYQRAMAREMLGDGESAMVDLIRAEELDPEKCEIVIALANVLADDGRADEGIERLNDFLQRHPDQPHVLIARGKLKHRLGETETGLIDVREAIRLDATNASFRITLAEFLIALARWERAAGELTNAITSDPSCHVAFALRGRCHLMIDKHLPAIHDFSKSIEIYPDQPETLAARGHAYLKNQQLVQAMADFESALNRSPVLLEAYTGRAIVMAKRGDSEAALIWLTKAFHRFDEPQAWAALLMTRGRIFFNMSRFLRAIGDYTTVMAFDTDAVTKAAATYARGVAFLHEGDTDAARHDFEQALKVEVRYRPAQLAVDWLDGKLRKRPKALIQPNQVVRPTRPRIVTEPISNLEHDDIWEIDPPFDQWILKTSDSVEFGPAPKAVFDQWVQEGRIDAEARLLRTDWTRWRKAVSVYAELDPEFVWTDESDDPKEGDESPANEESDKPSVDEEAEKSKPDAKSLPSDAPKSNVDATTSQAEPSDKHASSGVDYQQFEALEDFLPKLHEGELPSIEIDTTPDRPTQMTKRRRKGKSSDEPSE